MLLHTNEKIFKEIVIATAQHIDGLQNHQVEKDYFVSLFLKELSKIDNNVDIVFKGGTSLSKCYDVIDRFSEDIDLTINFPNEKAGKGLRKRLKESIIAAIDSLKMNFINSKKVQSDRDFNTYEVEFKRLFESTPEMIPYIKIETISVYKPYPCETKLVSNYITKYLSTLEEGAQIIKQYDLEAFDMKIQSIDRTFIDKLFALCDYHLAGTYHRYSRHIYDIHMIWSSGLLNKTNHHKLIDNVLSDRQQFHDKNLSSKPGSMPRKIINEIIDKEVFKEDFNDVTLGFIYKKVEYEDCIQSLKEVLDTGLVPEVVRAY